MVWLSMEACEQALYFATGEYLRHLPREGYRVLFVDKTNGCLSRAAFGVLARGTDSPFRCPQRDLAQTRQAIAFSGSQV